MNVIRADRPTPGWGISPWGYPTFVLHDASVLDLPPKRDGFTASFIARHGVGPGSWTRWSYRPIPESR